jgi:hypothetical protein
MRLHSLKDKRAFLPLHKKGASLSSYELPVLDS